MTVSVSAAAAKTYVDPLLALFGSGPGVSTSGLTSFPSGAISASTASSGTGDGTVGAAAGGFAQTLSSAMQALLVQFQAGAGTTDSTPATQVAASTASSTTSGSDANPLLKILQEVQQVFGGSGTTADAGAAVDTAEATTTAQTATAQATTPGSFTSAFNYLAQVAQQALQAYSASGALSAASTGGLSSFA